MSLWTTADGREMHVEQMDDGHLLNAIRYMKNRFAILALSEYDEADPRPRELQEKHRNTNLREAEEKVNILVAEAKRRKLDAWFSFGIKAVEDLE